MKLLIASSLFFNSLKTDAIKTLSNKETFDIFLIFMNKVRGLLYINERLNCDFRCQRAFITKCEDS